jgi:hypothetical protein
MKKLCARRRHADLPDPMKALSVYVGAQCIGFLLSRGRQGVEAFDAETRSLGLFPDQKRAAAAVSRAGDRHG